MKRRGWFSIPGVQFGDRTVGEQMRGLAPALLEARGKRVLDLGCAEGLIALEFAAAGATVRGIELVDENVAVARTLAKRRGLREWAVFETGRVEDLFIGREPAELGGAFDMVLALSIVNKLDPPEPAFQALGRWTMHGGLCVLRLPAAVYVNTHARNFAARDARPLMRDAGFELEAEAAGPRGEWVAYWRRDGLGR